MDAAEPIDISGGINLLLAPIKLPANEHVGLKNLYPTTAGRTAKRPAAAFMAPVVGDPNKVPISFIVNPFPAPIFPPTQLNASYVQGRPYLGVEWAGSVIDILNQQSTFYIGDFQNGFLASQRIPYIEGYRPAMLAHNGQIYCLPGNEQALPGFNGEFPIVRVSAGGTIETPQFPGANNNNFVPRVIGSYRGRLVLANSKATGYPRTLVFCDPLGAGTASGSGGGPNTEPLTMGDNAVVNRGFDLQQMGADEIIAVVEITQTAVGAPADSALLILGRNTAIIMTGEPGLVTDLSGPRGSVQFNMVNYPCGCASAETVVRTPYGVVWAGPDDVWAFQFGALPVRVGSKIRPALLNTAEDRQFLWNAVYDRETGSYRLAVGGPGQGQTVADTCAEQYWLDLRAGLPNSWQEARWYGPMVYVCARAETTAGAPEAITQGVYIMATDVRPNSAHHTLAFDRGINISGNAPYDLCILDLNTNSAYDSALNHFAVGGINPPVPINKAQGNEVTFEILTRAYDYGDIMVDKQHDGVEIAIWADNVPAIAVETRVAGGREIYTDTVVGDQTGGVVGVDALPLAPTHEYQSLLCNSDSSKTYTGNTFQFRIYDIPGYHVPQYDGIDQGAYVAASSVGAVVTEALLAGGVYADLTSFATMVATAFQAAIAAVDISSSWSGTIGLASIDPVTFNQSAQDNWNWYFQNAVLDATIRRYSRKVGAMLGFDTSADYHTASVGLADGTATAANVVPNKISCLVEIVGLNVRYNVFGRRPAGGYRK